MTNNIKIIAGVDEAGRGPLSGPVVVAGVILNPDKPIDGLGDSKKLSEKKRESLYGLIVSQAIVYSIVEVSPEEKAKSAKTAMLTSRVNTLLSLPMLLTMVMAQNLY